MEIAQVKHYDERINTAMDQRGPESVDGNYCTTKLEDQINFSLQGRTELDQYAELQRDHESGGAPSPIT